VNDDDECDMRTGPPCPICGARTYQGYGLMGGGIGPYVACDCGYFHKEQDEEP
jgi:hypothetical protein